MTAIPLTLTDEQRALRDGVADICKRYPGEYWRALDVKREYPEAFVNDLTTAGYLAALIPEQYGGARLRGTEGALIMETIHTKGGKAAPRQAQMVIMGPPLPPRSAAQKKPE